VKRVKCFAEEVAGLGSYTTLDAGIRVIEVRRITGTVNKCRELDSAFRTLRRRDRRERHRRRQLAAADLSYVQLPVIEVYLLRGEYYVLDGNRRVAAAKSFGLEFMDAHVTEVIPHRDREAQRGAVSRRRFEQETGIRGLRLDHESGYATLLEEVRAHRAGGQGVDRAHHWYDRVFLPACGLLRASELARKHPHLSPGDLFVLVAAFYRELMGRTPEGVSYPSLLSAFLFAHRVPSRRFFRRAPLRLLYRLLRGKV
jgi:hypothetical protein